MGLTPTLSPRFIIDPKRSRNKNKVYDEEDDPAYDLCQCGFSHPPTIFFGTPGLSLHKHAEVVHDWR
jgi:hypothetical protein